MTSTEALIQRMRRNGASDDKISRVVSRLQAVQEAQQKSSFFEKHLQGRAIEATAPVH